MTLSPILLIQQPKFLQVLLQRIEKLPLSPIPLMQQPKFVQVLLQRIEKLTLSTTLSIQQPKIFQVLLQRIERLTLSTIKVPSTSTPYANAEDPHFYEDASMITYTAKTESKCSTSKPSTVTKNTEDNVYEDVSSAVYKVGKTKFKISISIKLKFMMATVITLFVILSALFLFPVIFAKNYQVSNIPIL